MNYLNYRFIIKKTRKKNYFLIEFEEPHNAQALESFIAHYLAENMTKLAINELENAFNVVMSGKATEMIIESKFNGLNIKKDITTVFDTYYESEPEISNQFELEIPTNEIKSFIEYYLFEHRTYKLGDVYKLREQFDNKLYTV